MFMGFYLNILKLNIDTVEISTKTLAYKPLQFYDHFSQDPAFTLELRWDTESQLISVYNSSSVNNIIN